MSGRSTGSSGTCSPHLIIPPIITSDKDRRFLQLVHRFIQHEMAKIDEGDIEQRYVVHKSAFDQVIEYVHAYKPLLTAVKAEYEDCIETIKHGHREAAFLTGKLKAMASQPSTLKNYERRADQLEQRLEIINSDTARIKQQLQDLQDARKEREQKDKEILDPPKKEVKRDNRVRIPGLSLEEATDLETLRGEMVKLEQQVKELSLTQRTRYSSKEEQDRFRALLAQKVRKRDDLLHEAEILKTKRHRLKIATEAAQAYVKIQPPHQTIGDLVTMAFDADKELQLIDPVDGVNADRGTPSSGFEDDDPGREKEAEVMLEYIEKFNELFEEGKYEEAAIHAANSPKCILRTMETLQKFKDVENWETPRSPLLAFCDALMSSVLALGIKPTESMSVECVQCALKENRLDLLAHWIAQDRLTLSEKLADDINSYCRCKNQCICGMMAMAQRVYSSSNVGAHRAAVFAMVKQGRIQAAIECAIEQGDFTTEDYLKMLDVNSSYQLAEALIEEQESGERLVPIGCMVRALLQVEGTYDMGLHLLEDLYHQGPKGDGVNASAISQAILEDKVTTSEEWIDIVKSCQEHEYRDLGLEILAAVTVRGAMHGAAETHQGALKQGEEDPEATDNQQKNDKNQIRGNDREKREKENRGKEEKEELNRDKHLDGPKEERTSKKKKAQFKVQVEDCDGDQDAD